MLIDPHCITPSAIYLLYSKENMFINLPCHIVISYLPFILRENMFIDLPCHIVISYLPLVLREKHVY